MVIQQQPSSLSDRPQVSSMVKSRRRSVSPAEPSYRLAQALVKQEKWQEAIAAYQQALTITPNWVEVQRELGDLFLKLERWDEAVQVYETAISLRSESAEVYHNLGDALLKLQRWEDAIAAYEKAIELNPEFSWSYNNLGDGLRELQRWDEAAQAYGKAIELKPDFALSHHNLGDILVKKEDWEGAIAAYQKAINLDPNFVWSHYNLAEVYVKLDQWDEAVEAYRQVLKTQTDLVDVEEKLNQALHQQVKARLETALSYYRKAIENDPTDVESYQKALEIKPDDIQISMGLAKAWTIQGEIEKAFQIYQSIIIYASFSAEVYFNLSDILIQMQQLEEANEYKYKVLEFSDDCCSIYYNLVVVFCSQENWELALKTYQKIDEKYPNFWENNPTDYKIHHQLGDVLLEHFKFNQAVIAYQRSISLNPYFAWSYCNLGITLYELEHWEEAINNFYKAIELNPNLVDSYYYIGEVFYNLKNLDEAIKFYSKALEIDSNFTLAQENLQKVLKQKKKSEQTTHETFDFYYNQALFSQSKGELKPALDYFKKAIEISPDFYKAYLKIADILVLQDQLDEAIINYRKAIEINPSEVWSYNNLGEALVHKGRISEAIQAYQSAIQVDSKFCLSYARLGEALERQEELDKAIEFYSKALEIDPNFTLAKENLQKVLKQQKQSEKTTDETFDFYYNQALFSQSKGELKPALDYFKKAIEISPDFYKAYLKIADILVLQDQLDEAIINYRKAIEINPSEVWSYNNLGEALVHKGRISEAIQAYQSAIQVDSKFCLSYARLGEALERQEELDKAIEFYSKALEIDPNFTLAKENLEKAIAKQKYLQEMEDAYQKASQNLKNQGFDLTNFYVLDAHAGDPSGLGVVARRCSDLSQIVANSQGIAGKVLVPGRPDLYYKLVRRENINYIWTTFESNQLPNHWVEAINRYFTEVFVPHLSVLQVFQKSGVKRPITVLPQGYPERCRVKPLQKKPNQIKLGILGSPTHRKNFEKLIEAVQILRQQGRNVELKIHCPWLVDESQRTWDNLAGITLTEGKCSDEEINLWYSDIDAYIYPSSGEGWSFTPREAMSLGIPTIISDIPVHQELVDSGFYMTIKSQKWEPAFYEFLKDYCGEWKTYSIQQICEAIIELMDNYDYWYCQAQQGKEWITNECAWEPIKNQILAEIFPKHILLCPSKNQDCGIHIYSLDLAPALPDTKYVGSYNHLQEVLQREPIQSIHVQHEFGIFDTSELLFHVRHWNCKKQITLHSVIKGYQNPLFLDLLHCFDDVFVLTPDAQSEILGAKYIPIGTYPPVKIPLLPKVDPPIVASFGFIHEKKGYFYIVEATKRLGLPWRIVGKLKQEFKERVDVWEQNIKSQSHIQHYDGFFSDIEVFRLLSEASVLVFYYEDNDDYLYQSAAVLKAARCQRPIICSTATPLKELQGCVHYVPYADVEALTTGINLLVECPEYGQALVKAMNNYLVSNQWEIIGKKIINAQ